MNPQHSELRAVILDTETTAAKETPERRIEVIELAYRDIHSRELFLRRYKPLLSPQWGALAVHGITMVELEGCPPRATPGVRPRSPTIGSGTTSTLTGRPSARRLECAASAHSPWHVTSGRNATRTR